MDNNDFRVRTARWTCARVWLLCAAAGIGESFASHCIADEPRFDGVTENLRNTQQTRDAEKVKHHEPDLSARKQTGTASFYANEFAGRPMADGAPMDPEGDNAASKTLPLGTTAKVTNLETGASAVITIRDRGPYVPGRIVDLSPATAHQIGITRRKGLARVVVAPIAVPQPDGNIKLGAAAHEPLPEPLPAKNGVPPEHQLAGCAPPRTPTGPKTLQILVSHP